ncbi:Sec-independent protein translocase subunit TatA [Candidatus Pelagibacter sp. Uisw_127]|uniref:Sec-independent protein translocase subunit TatA n=1 Tax=Candidatus Pelagibacter sp. Uisw_127 TaxID=3230988 RepID=UPI0039E9F94D
MSIGIWQIAIVVILVVLLFGRGKISSLMGDVAKGIKSFKKGMATDITDEPEPKNVSKNNTDLTDEPEPKNVSKNNTDLTDEPEPKNVSENNQEIKDKE